MALVEVRSKSSALDWPRTSYFREAFEGLCQYHSSSKGRTQQKTRTVLELAAGRATKDSTNESSISTASWLLKNIEDNTGISSADTALMTIRNVLPALVLKKTLKIPEVPLGSLDSLYREMQLLTWSLADTSGEIAQEPLEDLNLHLAQLHLEVYKAHELYLEPQSIQSLETLLVDMRKQPFINSSLPPISMLSKILPDGKPSQLAKILEHYLAPSLHKIHQIALNGMNITSLAAAWISFFIGSLLLYVPDRPLDPASKPMIECDLFKKRRQELETRLGALEYHEERITGQRTNLRCRVVKEAMRSLGRQPQAVQVARPVVSELMKLQGEFTNILNVIVRRVPDVDALHTLQGEPGTKQEMYLIKQNIDQVIRRVSDSFRGYDDITKPLISLLRGLDVGLTLALIGDSQHKEGEQCLETIYNLTPFLGFEPTGSIASIVDIRSPTETSARGTRLTFLKLIALDKSVNHILRPSTRHVIHHTFQSFYDDWRKELAADQDKLTAKSSIYRYRGSHDENNEGDMVEFESLFPDFHATEEPGSKRIDHPENMQGLAQQLSNCHQQLFMESENPSTQILGMLRDATSQIGALWDSDKPISNFPISAERMLPSVVLALSDSSRRVLGENSEYRTLNFYTDPNLAEARKVINAVRKVQDRFREITAHWPEHTTLRDVLRTADELLALRHTDPLAKIITKCEQLHSYVHEWQIVASREFSASAVYDELTNLLVSWRRLELSTWARLLDMEDEKCKEDAKSWWFVAFEVIIAASLPIASSEVQLQSHVNELVATLSDFMRTTTMGQYSQRLRLIESFREHIGLLSEDLPAMSVVRNALSNFLRLFTRFEAGIKDLVHKVRKSLEKDLKDILLLASWKDTNIMALRESAKRSHHKLFKVVRKYRTLLSQPAKTVIEQGLADDARSLQRSGQTMTPVVVAVTDPAILRLCQDNIRDWQEKAGRFTASSKTTAIMVRMSEGQKDAVDCTSYVDSFATNLVDTIKVLQQETPSTLTVENKDAVKHLKSRKRKLFADTLKVLRLMGFKSNLSKDLLNKQESISIILANTPSLDSSIFARRISSVDLDLHKVLTNMPFVRDSSRQHSEELNGSEISRSVGLLEGVLSVLLQQRTQLASSFSKLQDLDEMIVKLRNLWAPEKYNLQPDQGSSFSRSHLVERLRWIPSMIEVGSTIAKQHNEMGQLDCSEILEGLSQQGRTFSAIVATIERLPELPRGISTSLHRQTYSEALTGLELLQVDLTQWHQQYPKLGSVMKKIEPWASTDFGSHDHKTNGVRHSSFSHIDGQISTTIDAIRVSLQYVEETLAAYPRSSEDTAWLLRADAVLSKSIKMLHVKVINDRITEILTSLGDISVDEPDALHIAAALCTVALPIIQQYRQIYQSALQRYLDFHGSLCRMARILTASFKQIASQGFCSASEHSTAEDCKTEKLEGGTGLGEGQGAEDISKDIQDDEDMSELAQAEDKEKDNEDIEDQEHAIDMQHDDMGGETGGDVEEDAEDSDGQSPGGTDEMDDETGEVDDIDPSAVDEKLWEGSGDDAEKDKEGDESKEKKKDDITAQHRSKADESDTSGEAEDIEEPLVEEGEEVAQTGVEKIDSHLQEQSHLDLPEEMDLDGGAGSAKNSDTDGMEDMLDDDQCQDRPEDPDSEQDEAAEGEERSDPTLVEQSDQEENSAEGEKTEDAGSPVDTEPENTEEDDSQGLLRDRNDDATIEADKIAPSYTHGLGHDDQQDDKDHNQDSSAESKNGTNKNTATADEAQAPAEDGEPAPATQRSQPTQGAEHSLQDTNDTQMFKKLGEALEKWHRQNKQIQNPSDNENRDIPGPKNTASQEEEFEHLPNNDAMDETQALGAAPEDQAQTLNQRAFDSEMLDQPQDFLPDEVDDQHGNDNHDMVADAEVGTAAEKRRAQGRAGAILGNASSKSDPPLAQDANRGMNEDGIEELDNDLSTIHLESEEQAMARSADEARRLWSHYESLTRNLSLSLTEQLRLILAPTLATKMRGDFRTGKRLNIKRIIPYVASHYKRDKIWMRRSVPSKRSYQIMLAVDDSKSMGESGSGQLAFETLALVSRSLSMLEVGEICIVGFGDEVHVAHEFDQTFSSETGVHVFQQLGFQQPRTNVRKLIAESTKLFREARSKTSDAGVDLWQLELIISDGVCENHESIRRLVRQAQEERIMIVFVIVDALKGESIMDMTEATFEPDAAGETKLKIKRYLDGFPFGYYLIVGDVKELPGVLATALRQWFAEVAESS